MRIVTTFSTLLLFGVAALAQSAAPSIPNIFPGLTVFGDSAACGYGATRNGLGPNPFETNAFPALMAQDFGGALTNYCYPGDWSEDTVREWVMPYVSPTDQRNPTYVVEIGGNDAPNCRSSLQVCLAAYTYSLQASVAWLAIPSSCKVLGQSQSATSGLTCGSLGPPSPLSSPTTGAAWVNDNFTVPATEYAGGGPPAGSGFPNPANYPTPVQPLINGIATYTNLANTTLTIPITTVAAGQNVYCGWRASTTYTSTASFSIDGSQVDTWNTLMPITHLNSLNMIVPGTYNETTDTIFVKYYSISSVGSHTLTIESGSNVSGTNPFSFVWCGLASQNATTQSVQQAVLSAVSSVSGSSTTYSGSIYGGGNPAIVGKYFMVTGFTNSGNNGVFAVVSSTPTSLTLNNPSGVVETATGLATSMAFPITSVNAPSGGTTTYNGNFPGGAANAYAGVTFAVGPFASCSGNNNGTFVATASTATTLTLANPNGCMQSPASATAVAFTVESTQSAYESGQPRVLMTGVARQECSGCADDATTAIYDGVAHGIATAFAQDGLQVSIAEVRSYVNYPSDYYVDALHPNNVGHQHVRDAYEAAVMNSFYQSRATSQVANSCGRFSTTPTLSSDVYVCSKITPSSKCELQPLTGGAAAMFTATYISSKTFGSMTIVHPASAGTFDVVCSQQ